MINLPGTGSNDKQISLHFKPKPKPKVPYVMPKWLSDYIAKREKCITLSKQGFTNEQIKQQIL